MWCDAGCISFIRQCVRTLLGNSQTGAGKRRKGCKSWHLTKLPCNKMPNKRWISGEMYVSYLLDLVTLTHFITFSSSAVTGFGMSPPGKRERRHGAEARFAPRRCRTGSCHTRGQRYPLCWPHLWEALSCPGMLAQSSTFSAYSWHSAFE